MGAKGRLRLLLRRAIFLYAVFAAPCQGLGPLTVNDLFDRSQVQEIRITIAPADWLQLKRDYQSSTDYRCDMEWRGLVVRDAAIRTRGLGNRNPIKPALTIDFNRFLFSQEFLGMNSLVLRSSSQDPTLTHEWLSMAMFHKMGLPSLREAHAKLFVNGEYVGLYLMVEPIDKRYLRSRFGESDGYLFEYNWTGDGYEWQYLGPDPALYVPSRFEPKTHQDNPDPQWIVDLLAAVNLSSDAEFAAAVSQYIDMDAFMVHTAIHQFMANWDSVIGEGGSANFYLYRRAADNHGVILAWDNECSFTGEDWSIWRNTQRNALMKRALEVPEFRRRYLETLAEAARVAGAAGGWLETEAARLIELIRQAALEDPARVCQMDGVAAECPWTIVQWSFDRVMDFARLRRPAVEAELAAAGFELPAYALEPGAAMLAGASLATLAPGALAWLDFPSSSETEASATVLPLPRELAGITIRMSGLAVPLLLVQPFRALFQVPLELAPGPHSLDVSGNGLPTNAIMVEVRPSVPAVVAVTHAHGTLAEPDTPAAPGETIVLYGTGFGVAKQPLASGQPAPANPPLTLEGDILARIGGRKAKVVWAGFTAGFAGLQQVVVELPDNIQGRVPITLTMHEEPRTVYELAVR